MSNLPITSRIKRSPLRQQVAGAIDPENPNVVTARGIIKGKPTTSTETITTKRKPTGVSYEDAYKKADKTKYPTFESFKNAAIDYNKKNDTVTETKTTVTPGEDSSWEETLKVKTTGDVFQPWETRQMSRSIKKEQRDIRRAKIKEARESGTLTPELRKQFKAEEAKAEKEEFQAMADRAKAARGSGKRGGTSDVTTGDRDATLVDVGDINAQTAYLNKKYGTGNSSEDDVKNKEEQKKISEEGAAGRDADDEARKNKTGIYAPKEEKKEETPKSSPAEMKPSAFKMYAKSPAAKKLQGAQNTLPQHLQDAIKAAPGKMRGPLKKGYFKKY